MKTRKFRFVIFSILIILLANTSVILPIIAQEDFVGKWRRYVISLPNNTYLGNPFALEVDCIFTHTSTGVSITIPGYYAGNNTWKIAFMPTLIGEWTYATSSSDSDLTGVQGTVVAVESGHRGMLKGDSINLNKWKFADGNYVVPIALRMEFFMEPASTSAFVAVADFMKKNNIHMLDTRLLEEDGQFENGRHDFIFNGNWQNHNFDLAVWDRMEERMEILTEHGLGAHIMFYSDDAGKPGWSGKSITEALVIRYVVARLAGYPTIWFNTGIDISEYRSQDDIDWWGRQIKSLDPYDHPISSRYGGGSGSIVLSGQTFDSRGDNLAKINNMTSYFNISSVPVSFDDAWYENSPQGIKRNKNYSEHDIRRAFWKLTISGGVGGLIRGFDGFFHINDVQTDLESEEYLSLINPFIEANLGDTFGSMVPEPSLVSKGYAAADPQRTKILYFFIGKNDRYDGGSSGNVIVKLYNYFMGNIDRYDGGSDGNVILKLSALNQTYIATWYDPRSSKEMLLGSLSGGRDHVLTPPSTDDWILLLTQI